jgi:uncharacterized protein (DUF58 family)
MELKLRPTKRWFAFVPVWFLSLLPAALTNGPAGYLPGLTLLFCVLLSLGHLLLVKDRLDCAAQPERAELTRGEEICFTAQLRNKSRLPVPLLSAQFFISDESGCDAHRYPIQMSLAPGEERSFSLTASFAHVGVYQAGLRGLTVTDLFGLFRSVSAAEERRTLSIQPKLLELDSLPVSDRQTAENDRAQTASALSGMDYMGVREYAYGDPIKMIQWKLSAHAGGLMTKQMESYTNSGVAVVLDFCIPDQDSETIMDLVDAVAETGVAAGAWAAQRGMDYVLVLPGEDGLPRSCTPASFRDLGPWLPYFRPRPKDEDGRLAQALRDACGGSHAQTNVVVCAADLTEDTLSALSQLKQSRKNPVFYLLAPKGLDEVRRKQLTERLTRLQYAGIPCRMGSSVQEVTA